MKLKGFSRTVREDVIGSLREKGLLNDKRFAEEWVDSRLRQGPRSKTAIEAELTAKGISGGTIEEVFGKRAEELDDRAIASRLIRDKLLSCKRPLDIKKKAAIYRFLISRGINSEIAEEMINEI